MENESKMIVVFCSFCHKGFNTFNPNAKCKFCDAPKDWHETSQYHIDKWNEKKLPYTLEEYIEFCNRIRQNGVSFYYPHHHGCSSFEQEKNDYPLTQLDVIQMIEENMEILVDAVTNHRNNIDIDSIFKR